MPEEIKQEYIPPTYGALFMDTYLKSHRQRMQTSLALAQQELRTDQALLEYYAKKEKEYLEYIEGVGTAGTGRGSSRSIADKRFERKKAALQLAHQVRSDRADQTLKIEKFVEDEFSVPLTANINEQARKAALQLGADMTKVKTAIRGTTGVRPGTNEAKAAAIALYNEMKSQANIQGFPSIFDSNDRTIRNEIANHFGVPDAAAMMLAPDTLQKAKEDRKARLQTELGQQTIDDATLNKLLREAGITPTQPQQTTGTQPVGPSQTAKEQEDLMASRLEGIQRKMSQLEDKIQKTGSAEALLDRARTIYSNEYTNAGPFSKRGQAREARQMLNSMSTEQRFLFDALNVAKGTQVNPYYYVPKADDTSIEAKANELYQAIIANAGSGKAIDIASMAAKMDPKQAEKIAGLALKATLTHLAETDPLEETRKKQDAETTVDAIDNAIEDTQDQIAAVEEEKTVVAQDATKPPAETIPVPEEIPKELIPGLPTDGTVIIRHKDEFNKGIPAFPDQQSLDDFLATRTGMYPEDVERVLGASNVSGDQALAISDMTQPITAAEQAILDRRPNMQLVPKNTKLTGESKTFYYVVTGYNEDATPIFKAFRKSDDSPFDLYGNTKTAQAALRFANKFYEEDVAKKKSEQP